MNVRVFSGWAFSPQTLDSLVQDVVGRTSSARLADEVWIGWSLGGMQAIAMVAERQHEEGACRPGYLVLVASTAKFCRGDDGWPGTAPAVLRGLQRRLERDPPAALADFHASCAGSETPPETLHSRTATSLSLDRVGLVQGLRTLAHLDVRPLLSRVRLPVLVLHGKHDRIIPPAAADRLAEMLPQATQCEHPTAGHDLPLAQARWTADRIVEFLCR